MKTNLQTYQRQTSPASEPLSLSEVKKHLRLDDSCTDEDDFLNSLITVARESVENYTNLLIGSQKWVMYQDFVAEQIELNKLPVISIDSFEYIDEDGDTQTMSDFTTIHEDIESYPARLQIEELPDLYEYGYNKVIINFTAGLIDIPKALTQAMLLMIGHWYENRQDVVTGTQVNEVPETSKFLMDSYIYYELR